MELITDRQGKPPMKDSLSFSFLTKDHTESFRVFVQPVMDFPIQDSKVDWAR